MSLSFDVAPREVAGGAINVAPRERRSLLVGAVPAPQVTALPLPPRCPADSPQRAEEAP